MSHRVVPMQPLRQKGRRRRRAKPAGPGQREPRQIDKAHKGRIAQLPCVICLSQPVEVAHVRFADAEIGKRETGKSQKPSDRWTLPLCAWHHRIAPDAQHKGSESTFWERHNIDSLEVCIRLYAVSTAPIADDERIMVMSAIVRDENVKARGAHNAKAR